MLGYGHEVWSAGNYYFWIPMVAPFCGCTFGGWLYDMFIFTGGYASPCLCYFYCVRSRGERCWQMILTGESPINTPWMGWKRILRPGSGKSKKIESHVWQADDKRAREQWQFKSRWQGGILVEWRWLVWLPWELKIQEWRGWSMIDAWRKNGGYGVIVGFSLEENTRSKFSNR
jgi:hypothetical protein